MHMIIYIYFIYIYFTLLIIQTCLLYVIYDATDIYICVYLYYNILLLSYVSIQGMYYATYHLVDYYAN